MNRSCGPVDQNVPKNVFFLQYYYSQSLVFQFPVVFHGSAILQVSVDDSTLLEARKPPTHFTLGNE